MSSATYHTFAGLVDISLLPFYAFASILAHQNLVEPQGTNGHWTSFSISENLTTTIIQALFLTGAVMAGLHAISFMIDIYLVLIFRKIANLPPDMNPLEDNLTSRVKKSKHKYKDSNATLVNPDIYKSKHESIMSDSTLTIPPPSPDRTSKTSAFSSREPALPEVNARNISFFHTRNDSDSTFNPHNPRTARLSRAQLEGSERGSMYQQPFSAAASRADVASTREPTLAEHRASLLNGVQPHSIHQSNKSFVSTTTRSYDPYKELPVPPIHDDLQSDNWIVNSQTPRTSVKDFGSETRHGHRRAKSQYDVVEDPISARGSPNLNESGTVRRPRSYQPVKQTPEIHIDTPSPAMRPLAMNPPSPLYPSDGEKENKKEPDVDTYSIDSGSHYSQPSTTSTSGKNSIGTGLRNSGTPKGKYYGDLASATRGIMHTHSPPPNRPFTSHAGAPPVPGHRSGDTVTADKHEKKKSWFGAAGLGSSYSYGGGSNPALPANGTNRSSQDTANPNLYSQSRSPYMQGQGDYAPSSFTSYQSSSPSHGRGKSWQAPEKNTPTRVVSRTGADYEDISMGVGIGGGNRRRDVSGKVAEEGRGGFGWGGFGGPSGWGLRGRKTSTGVS